MTTTDKPICVTGASGFIASHIVAQLLEAGYRVRGTVRKEASDYPHLTSLPGADERLELVSAQLLDEGAFDAAVAGCEVVMHTASPYTLTVEDPQRDLVEPAVKGTLNVLEACRKAETVRRVVLTSSMAAVTDEPDSDHVYTEADWNEKSSLSRNPYYYSKTMAERAAWEFAEKTAPGAFELVVINPFMVIGPSMTSAINTSNQIFVDLVSGAFPGIPNIAWGFVDVRDVARAHVLAMERPEASGRYVCATDTLTMRQVIDVLKEGGYGDYKLPKLGLESKAGDVMVKLFSHFQPKGVGTFLRTHVGRIPRFDNEKIRRELGIELRPVKESILDTMTDLKRWDHLPAPRR